MENDEAKMTDIDVKRGIAKLDEIVAEYKRLGCTEPKALPQIRKVLQAMLPEKVTEVNPDQPNKDLKVCKRCAVWPCICKPVSHNDEAPQIRAGHTGECHPGCQCDVAKMRKPSKPSECEHKWINAMDNNYDEYKVCIKCHNEVVVDKPSECDLKKRILSILEHNQVLYGDRMQFIPTENYENTADGILTEIKTECISIPRVVAEEWFDRSVLPYISESDKEMVKAVKTALEAK